MNHHDVFDAVIHDLARLKEEFAFAAADLLLPELRLALFVNRVVNDAIMILLEDYDVYLLDKLLLGVNYMDIFNRFIY